MTRLSPPSRIEGLEARPSMPLEFSHAWLGKVERVRRRRAELRAAGRLDGAAPDSLAALGAALSGVLRVPVIPVRYADVAAPFGEAELSDRLFGPVRGDTMSYAAYWREVSGGLLEVEGVVAPWVRLDRPARHYLPREAYGWASFGRMSEFRDGALRAADRYLDFGDFDNDGPDGVPNSGDDDGYVDFVALVYATDCGGEWREGAIWPHRGAMAPFQTNDAAAGGGAIQVTDYVILPAVEPGTCSPMQIGVLAHETGHALGLPDLYDYDGPSQGIGAWGLMGTGSHSASFSPAHPSAWEKEQLGWIRVEWLREDRPGLVIEPVLESRTVYRYDLPNTGGEYLLLENRQREGSDSELPGSGLLIWRIDMDRGELGAWSGDERHEAVRLIEADGRADLRQGRLADASDPFPGAWHRQVFELRGSPPFRLTGIVEAGGVITADVAIGYARPTLASTPAEVELTASAGEGALREIVSIRPQGGADRQWQPRADAPWLRANRVGDTLVVEADPAGLEPGVYRDTVELAVADSAGGSAADSAGGAVAGRIPVRLDVAAPGVAEVVAREVAWSWGLAARDGRIFQAGYGWDALGLRPRPRLIRLAEAGFEPQTTARLPVESLYAPVATPDGGAYVLGQAGGENYLYRVAPDGRAEVVAAGFSDAPAYGAAALRDGSLLVADWSGSIHWITADGDVRPWTRVDAHVYQIAADSTNRVYVATYEGDVLRIGADGRVTTLETGFGPGRLVAIAATPDGQLFAAERGGAGRILHFDPDGTVTEVGRQPGAAYYGLALDDGFLYALDLGHRQLVRIAPPTTPRIAAADGGSD
ncbi:MAG TPA: M6 family metalloprotease domain-containing protein [Longimicrobiales bacterium]